MSQVMSEANPYTAPDAALDTGLDALYQPKIFSFNGRIGRMRYLAYGFGISFLLVALVSFLTAMAGAMGAGMGDSSMGIVGIILIGLIYIAVIVLSVAFAKRRFNDLNRSGWWLLLFLIPVVNLIVSIYLVFFPGTEGPNNFGPAPAANSIGVLIVGWIIPVLFILGIVAAVAIPQYQSFAPGG
ncbi:MAG: DUF805 domain-containing protein [Gammaproteobacteria bacterium]|nr:DUF805 domain-containing protein [Gammaproteobacteria bacterium]MDH3535393.1 DUF805 domain-containing protein [Gammaproteobacteria bacterium]